MILDKEGLEEWLKDAELVTTEVEKYSGNIYEKRIYRKNNKLYLLSACNGTINSKWHEGKGYKKDYNDFEPIEVTQETYDEEVHYTLRINSYKTLNGETLLTQEQRCTENEHRTIGSNKQKSFFMYPTEKI